MIITLKGADFSKNNIGPLSSWLISREIGVGARYSGPVYVSKGGAFSATVVLAEGYTLDSAGVTVIMGGTTVTSGVTVNGNTITINIASVTGNVVIKVPTKNTSTGEEDGGNEEPETPVNPPSGGSNYIDITVQGTEKGSIKDSVIKIPDSSSLYLITKVLLPSNAISVEYQAFKTGGSYGSAFVNGDGTVVQFLPRTDVTTGDRVTATVPRGATWFYHMYDDPSESTQTAPTFTYIRVYTEGEIETPEGLPVRVTVQNENNHGLLDATTGVFKAMSFGDGGGQTVTVCPIPAGATTVNYQMFKTSSNYGSCFKDASGTFISGHVNKTENVGTRKTLSIPSGATEFWHMYPDSTYAQGDGNCPVFDYIEFA